MFLSIFSVVYYQFSSFSDALTLIKTIRRIGMVFFTHNPIADYHMGDYYLSIVPFEVTNDKNETIDRRTYVPQHSFSV